MAMLPKEIWTQAPLVDVEGDGFMRVENYQTILEFSETKLRLQMKGMIYEIIGEHLLIRGVTKREIFIEGQIRALQMKREENL
ncbi:MAG: hypothetical protein HFE64_06605 [Lachnospiraceae bacterium]|jgi:sporulation protein YqfC|nr:hypothetical protein [Lachnospiraceae bacterium]